MYRLHVSVHRRPESVRMTRHLAHRERVIAVLDVDPEISRDPLPVSFEDAAATLELLPNLYFEPDGSFVYANRDALYPEQLEGQLFDRDGLILYLELKGVCSADMFDAILQSIGWPAATLMFQLLREGFFLDEDQFRSWASMSD